MLVVTDGFHHGIVFMILEKIVVRVFNDIECYCVWNLTTAIIINR